MMTTMLLLREKADCCLPRWNRLRWTAACRFHKILPVLLLVSFEAALRADVRVWQDTLVLPTYEEGEPDPNPPFDQFAINRINYPYTLRNALTDRRMDRNWRALILENEFIRVVVLPDLGGHIYSCVDKINGREMFYANPSIKKALIGYRGAWAAFGVEFNFPVSHNWVSMSPVDFAIEKNSDGSGAIQVGGVDRVYGMQWRVRLVLREGSTVLEQQTTLYNPTDFRHRYYWWNNAAVEVWDDSRIVYPTRFTASHGFTRVDTWPVNSDGLDLSVIKNHLKGSVSLFTHGTREPFMGVYHPRTGSGTAHYAESAEVPTKKFWSWGVHPDGLDWRTALSDNESAYIEIQSGLFRNQETYAFLGPQQMLRVREYWMPVRDTGGITRSNRNAILHMRREPASGGRVRLKLDLNVNQVISDAAVRLLRGAEVLFEHTGDLHPRLTFSHVVEELPSTPEYTFELVDSTGRKLLFHTENRYDWLPAGDIQVGPQDSYRSPAAADRTDGDIVEIGRNLELNGRRVQALGLYRAGLERFPDSFELRKATGRLAVALKQPEEAIHHLRTALRRAHSDSEIHYYLGCAYERAGDKSKARNHFEAAGRQFEFRAPALLALSRLAARDGNLEEGLLHVQRMLADHPGLIRAGAVKVAILRTLGQRVNAEDAAGRWLKLDPANSFLRHERVKLGNDDDALWRHLAADPERVLELVVQYLDLGLYADALALLERRYPAVDPLEAEPGAVLPQDHPLVRYYRGYCRELIGHAGAADFRAASRLSTRYVFPNRDMTQRALEAAIRSNPEDASAHFLLGSIRMSADLVNAAIESWQTARRLNPGIPALHRNLGRTLLTLKRDDVRAAIVYREGLESDPGNKEIYLGLNQSLAILGRPAAERAAVLFRYPDQTALPQQLVYELALSLAEAGNFEMAERQFENRFFAREEHGINVREVYVEVQLLKALALAREGRPAEAAAVARLLGAEVTNLPFTRDGMQAFVNTPRVQYFLGNIMSHCGDEDAARAYWKTAESGQARGLQLAFAANAAFRLSETKARPWRERLAEAIARSERDSQENGAVQSSTLVVDGLLLQASGRMQDAAGRFEEALRLPNRTLSHYLARTSLQEIRAD